MDVLAYLEPDSGIARSAPLASWRHVVKALGAHRLIVRAAGEHDYIIVSYFPPGAQVPAKVDVFGQSPNTNSTGVFVTAKADEMNAGAHITLPARRP